MTSHRGQGAHPVAVLVLAAVELQLAKLGDALTLVVIADAELHARSKLIRKGGARKEAPHEALRSTVAPHRW